MKCLLVSLRLLITSTLVLAQTVSDVTVTKSSNNIVLAELSISIWSYNNLIFYKPINIYEQESCRLDILTGMNFAFGNPFDINSFTKSNHRRYLEYEFFLRQEFSISEKLSIGAELGTSYKYLVTNQKYSGKKWNERLGLLIIYNISEKVNLIMRAAGTLENASVFGCGFQYKM